MKMADWIVLASSIGLVWVLSGSSAPTLVMLWHEFTRLARNDRLSVAAIGAVTIIVRMALLPWLRAPEPSVHDEFSYLLAADTFMHGRLANPPHPLWTFFDTFHVIQHPTYASIYPAAQGAALAVGKLLGDPWYGVLFSTVAMCMALTWMLQAWMPAQWALLGGALAVLRFGIFSYWMNSYWGGSVAAAGAALVLGAYPRIVETCRPRHLLAFGAGVAILATSRPVEGFILCAPVAAALLWKCLQRGTPAQSKNSTRILFTLTSTLVCIAGFIAYYNWRVTGSPLVFPHFIEQRNYITTPVFIWEHARPHLHYANQQFETFYNTTMPAMYQTSWNGAIKNMQDNALMFWQFFLGIAFSIPLLMSPWLLRDRKMWLPLTQFVLSSFGLLAVVWFHPHYAAPLFPAILLLIMQGLRHLRTWQYRNRSVGLALARFIVLLGFLTSPAAFLISRLPGMFRFWMQPVEGWLPLWVLSLLPLLLALVVLEMKKLNPATKGFAWRSYLEFLLLIVFVWHVCTGQRISHPSNYQFDTGEFSPPRTWVKQMLESMPGEHLVLVKYSLHHDVNQEYVYNDADIDHAKTVWAREIPGQNLEPLLTYFHDRDVWVLEPDEKSQQFYPYSPPPHSP